MGQRQQHSSFHRPADILAAFSRASQEAEQVPRQGAGRTTSIPQAVRSALRAGIGTGVQAVRCHAQAGRRGLTDLCRRLARQRAAPEQLSVHDASRDARQASRDGGSHERARLLSHFTIPDQEDGSATA